MKRAPNAAASLKRIKNRTVPDSAAADLKKMIAMMAGQHPGKQGRTAAHAVSEPPIKFRKESPLAGQTGRTKTAWLSLRPACNGYRRSVWHPFQVKFVVLKPAPCL